jgi:hypothetical protein
MSELIEGGHGRSLRLAEQAMRMLVQNIEAMKHVSM